MSRGPPYAIDLYNCLHTPPLDFCIYRVLVQCCPTIAFLSHYDFTEHRTGLQCLSENILGVYSCRSGCHPGHAKEGRDKFFHDYAKIANDHDTACHKFFNLYQLQTK